jgi:hypothetical protein
VQPPSHLFRLDIETALLPYTRTEDIGVLAYGTLAHGLLTGTMTEDTRFAADDWRTAGPLFEGEQFRDNLRAVADLAGDGADVADSPAVAATGADVVISMLTDGPASEAVMSGPDAWPAVARARRSRAHRAARDDPPVVAGVPSRAH